MRTRAVILSAPILITFSLALMGPCGFAQTPAPSPTPEASPAPELISSASLAFDGRVFSRHFIDPKNEGLPYDPSKALYVFFQIPGALPGALPPPSVVPPKDLQTLNTYAILLEQPSTPAGFDLIRDCFIANPNLLSGRYSDAQLIKHCERNLRQKVATIRNDAPFTVVTAAFQGIDENSAGFRNQMRQNLAAGLALYRMLDTSEAGFFSRAREQSVKMSTEDKIRFAQVLGEISNENYDHQRAKDGHGIVTCGDIIHGLVTGKPTGICGDIASCQAETLQEMGFQQCYVMGYNATVDRHATVLCQNPDNPHGIIQMDYSAVRRTDDRDGVAALAEYQDASTGLTICKPAGGCVARIPTELGTMLAEATETRVVNVFEDLEVPAIASMSLEHGRAKVNASVAELSSGHLVGVVGTHVDPAIFGKNLGRFAAAYAYETNRGPEQNAANHLYLGYQKELQSPTAKLGENTAASLHARASGDVDFTHSQAGDRGYEDEAKLSAGVEALHRSSDGQSLFALRGDSEFFVAQKDIRNADMFALGMAHNRSTLEGDYRHHDANGDVSAAAALGYTYFGPEAMTWVQWTDPRGRTAELRCQGAFNGKAPAWVPGMVRQCSVAGTRNMGTWLFQVRYIQPLSHSPPKLEIGMRKKIGNSPAQSH